MPHVQLEEHRQRVAPVLRVKSVSNSSFPARIFSQVRRSSIGFVEVVSELGSDFMVVSAYGSIKSKFTLGSMLYRPSPVSVPTQPDPCLILLQQSVSESDVRIGLRSQESTVVLESELDLIWTTKSPGKFYSYILEGIKKTYKLDVRPPTSLTQNGLGGTSQLSSIPPSLPTSPASQNSSMYAQFQMR